MALPATDNFAAGTTPVALETYSANWSIGGGAWRVETIVVAGTVVQPNSAAADCMAWWNADVPNADHYSQGKVYPEESSGIQVGVACRCSTTVYTCYAVQIHSWTGTAVTYDLYRVVASSFTLLATGSVSWNDGDVLRLEASGIGATVALVMKRNGTQFGATFNDTDASRITAAGRLGINGYNINPGSTGLDDWEGGNLAAGSIQPPRSMHQFRQRAA